VKIIFDMGETTSKKNLTSKKNFLKINEPWSTLPPPPNWLGKGPKSANIFPMGVLKKTRKT